MARQARLQAVDQIFWIRSRAGAGRTLFRHDRDRRSFLAALLDTGRSRGWKLWSWVLLEGSYHLLVRGDTAAVGAAVRDLNAAYSRARGPGRLFGGRFTAIIVDTETYLAPLAAWMFQLPVANGLATDPARWRWSAYPDLARMRRSVIPLDRGSMLARLGGEIDGLHRLRLAVAQASGESWNPEDHITAQLVLGNEEFLAGLRGSRTTRVPRASIGDIVAAVSDAWGIAEDDIRGGRGGAARRATAMLGREAGVTLKDTAAALGIGPSAVSRLLSSSRSEPLSATAASRLERARDMLKQSGARAEPSGGTRDE